MKKRLVQWLVLLWTCALAGSAWAQTSEQAVWGVNAGGQAWHWVHAQWHEAPHDNRLRQVSVGADGAVWAVEHTGAILQRERERERERDRWRSMPGAAVQVSVGSAQHVWVLNADEDIFRWTGAQWQRIPGRLVNISAAADGSVWGVNRWGNVFRRDGHQWTAMPPGPTQVSVGSAQQVWGVDAQGTVLRWDGHQWKRVGGEMAQVAVASDSSAWGVKASGAIYRRGPGASDQWQLVPGWLVQVSTARRETSATR